jgi:hypothetical protein
MGEGAVISTVMDGPYRLPYGLYRLPGQGAAQLRASRNSNCCCWYITKRILWTVITEITHFQPGHFHSMTPPVSLISSIRLNMVLDLQSLFGLQVT